MARNNIIDGLVVQLQATNGFDLVSKGTAVAYDHRVLASGVDRAAIVLAERFEHSRMVSGGKTETTYDLSVEVYIRHNTTVIEARRDADIYVGNILQRINNNPTLGGSAWDALVTSGRVEEEKMVIGTTPYLMEALTVSAKEHLSNV